MKTTNLVGLCAVTLLSATETRATDAEQQEKSPGSSADSYAPNFIACAQERGEPLGQCAYSIKRDENGKTTITVAFANGFKRGLFFRDRRFLKASVTMSGVGTDTDWSIKDGTHMIRVDSQRYEVPDTLIVGD